MISRLIFPWQNHEHPCTRSIIRIIKEVSKYRKIQWPQLVYHLQMQNRTEASGCSSRHLQDFIIFTDAKLHEHSPWNKCSSDVLYSFALYNMRRNNWGESLFVLFYMRRCRRHSLWVFDCVKWNTFERILAIYCWKCFYKFWKPTLQIVLCVVKNVYMAFVAGLNGLLNWKHLIPESSLNCEIIGEMNE